MKNLTEPPVPCSPSIVTILDKTPFEYKNEYARQRKIIKEFDENKLFSKPQKDDKLSKLFYRKSKLKEYRKTVFLNWDPIDFLDNSRIQATNYDLNDLNIEVFYKNRPLKDIDTELAFVTSVSLKEALQHVIDIAYIKQQILQYHELFDSSSVAVSVERVNTFIQEINQNSLVQHRHSLMDLVMSFSGIHPRLPDLFYSYELEVLR
jgi:hypothetical protein